MSVSGMGKTTLVNAALLRYPQVIKHTSYKGSPINCRQVTYLVLRIPHDATLRSLCLQFFDNIDRLLGTDYARQARSLRQIAPMVQLMSRVATVASVGVLVVDEAQNLRSARGGSSEFMLNLFSEIIERLGISLLVLATPAVQSVIEDSVRNARKLASYGETVLSPMPKNDPLWIDFSDTLWDYYYCKFKRPLSKDARDAWHAACAGNTAFAVLVFMLSQRNEIGGREIVDAAAFARTAAMDMAFLQPAIAALNSGDPTKLRAFDDLLFSQKYRALRKILGAKDEATRSAVHDEFSELSEAQPRTEKPRTAVVRVQRKPQPNCSPELPMENPLAL